MDAYVIKTDEKGSEEQHRTFSGEDDDQAFSVRQTADGGYIIAAASYGEGSDAYLVKDEEGNYISILRQNRLKQPYEIIRIYPF